MKNDPKLRKLTAALGRAGEDLAVEYLENCGMTILSRNWKCRAGELDIVAIDGDMLVFAEVKTLRRKQKFRPADNLSTRQRKRNHNAAKAYIRALNITGKSSRFDLIEIIRTPFISELQHHKHYLPDLPPLSVSEKHPPPERKVKISSFAAWLHHLCPGCGKFFFRNGGTFCKQCLEELNFFDQKYRCPGCGGENHGALEQCLFCLAEPPRPWQQAYALFTYQGYGKELIHRFKFGNEPELARPLGILAADLLLNSDIQADFLIPVPLNLLRLCQRGYNQSELIAKTLSAFTGIPVQNVLRRKFSLRSKQSTRNRKERHKGLLHIFTIRDPEKIRNKKILLVDDVLTTGATAAAAAQLLMDNGADSVNLICLARTISASPGIFDSRKQKTARK